MHPNAAPAQAFRSCRKPLCHPPSPSAAAVRPRGGCRRGQASIMAVVEAKAKARKRKAWQNETESVAKRDNRNL